MIIDKGQTLEITDRTSSFNGGRIREDTTFKTTWQKNPLKLLDYLEGGWSHESSDRKARLAIGRHKKEAEIYLGVRKVEVPTTVKIIYFDFGDFYIREMIEKPKLFLDGTIRVSKSGVPWTYWTPEKETAVREYEKEHKRAKKILADLRNAVFSEVKEK